VRCAAPLEVMTRGADWGGTPLSNMQHDVTGNDQPEAKEQYGGIHMALPIASLRFHPNFTDLHRYETARNSYRIWKC
jgi:hypothetical protein